ncbi:protein O-GlcNAcase [Stackebrandtia nassauensis]|uniref:Beta-N-acetylhexosaminidase n=1 Tax=Stackebrandtia nassauensis (strain DSM 44728 / CIP 108903 / NRRL B-16338 / NBRC 102104 / LLR-40K-21) TaxID=446470 RepID=D3Q4V4_STANL|nr:beta-N-acetylglucosaminidase domain-containing protein [Stackebrandtia nassauensis]ADD42134.1 Beta-N-acetylhexosaminidase [Stackebrandtia nassauensis DSM 44728]
MQRHLIVTAAVVLILGASVTTALALPGDDADRLITGPASDPAAEKVARDALADLPSDVVVRIGTRHTDAKLAAEGFEIRVESGEILLDGADAAGVFYGAQELRERARSGRLDDGVIRQEPSMRYRGLIEGFYGTPWTHAERLDLMDYLGSHRMNTYAYAPKDDPYHREKWREPYPADKLAELGELVERAQANHVDFAFALSPGLSICYTSQDDYDALIAKFDSLYDLGVRQFNIPLDDIDYDTWHCDGDAEEYGSGPAAAGRAQAELLTRVQTEWAANKDGVAPMQMVPTEYFDNEDSPYKEALRDMHSDVVVMWTGVGVIPTTITREQAARAREVFGHEILIWDNYPVNDYIAGRLPLGAYTGRENGLSAEVSGVISNPMNQPEVSKVALYSFGEYGWDDESYQAEESWERALSEAAGGSEEVVDALRRFADLNQYDETLHQEPAPELAAALDAFWEAWDAGDHDAAAERFDAVLADLAAAPDVIREGAADPAFAEQARAWLDAAELWVSAMRHSLTGMVREVNGDPEGACEAIAEATSDVEAAKEIRDDREPHSTTHPRIADGVADAYIDAAAGHAGCG